MMMMKGRGEAGRQETCDTKFDDDTCTENLSGAEYSLLGDPHFDATAYNLFVGLQTSSRMSFQDILM